MASILKLFQIPSLTEIASQFVRLPDTILRYELCGFPAHFWWVWRIDFTRDPDWASERPSSWVESQNIRYEEDLSIQLSNSSEKRLARILLLLAHFGKEGVPETVIPKISQETHAEMVEATQS